MTDARISIINACLRFRLYRNRSPQLKETVVQHLSGKNHNSVTEFDALKDINLEITHGTRLGILGLNGAGKSTLLKMVVGIYPPHQGEVKVEGKITPMIELGTGFDQELSGRENIYLNGALLGRSYKQMKRLEEAIIEFSELKDMIDLPIKYYSTGMHGRLAFSIGAICDPEILLMDEIFAAGDAQFVHKCLSRLHQMMNQSQILVLVSHENGHILDLCNRAIVLHKGRIVKDAEPHEAVEFYMNHIVRDEAHPDVPLEPSEADAYRTSASGRQTQAPMPTLDFTPGAINVQMLPTGEVARHPYCGCPVRHPVSYAEQAFAAEQAAAANQVPVADQASAATQAPVVQQSPIAQQVSGATAASQPAVTI